MTLTVTDAFEKGAPINLAEHHAMWVAVEDEVNAKANTADVEAALALKADADDSRLTDARVPLDGDYGLFLMASGVATPVPATAREALDGTANKMPDAARLKSMHGFESEASSAGVLTLNWGSGGTVTSLGVTVDVTENITSIALSNMPDYPVSILFNITGSFSVTIPAHNATVSGRTFKRLDGDLWPTLPATAGGLFILNMRKLPTMILASLGGVCAD